MGVRCLVWENNNRGRCDAVVIDGCGSTNMAAMEMAAVDWYQAWRTKHDNAKCPLRVTVEALGSGAVRSFDMSVRSPIVAVEVAR